MWSLREAVQHFQQYTTNGQLAESLGVHKNTVMNYASGKTVSCSDDVVDKFYDDFKVEGVPVLLDFFTSEAQYIELRQMRDKGFKVAPERDIPTFLKD